MTPRKTSGKKVPISTKAQLDQWVSAPETPTQTPPSPALQNSIEAPKMKRLTLDIPEDLHRSIKLNAVTQGVSMVDLLRTLLEENYRNL
jgi:hypothetical protein